MSYLILIISSWCRNNYTQWQEGTMPLVQKKSSSYSLRFCLVGNFDFNFVCKYLLLLPSYCRNSNFTPEDQIHCTASSRWRQPMRRKRGTSWATDLDRSIFTAHVCPLQYSSRGNLVRECKNKSLPWYVC